MIVKIYRRTPFSLPGLPLLRLEEAVRHKIMSNKVEWLQVTQSESVPSEFCFHGDIEGLPARVPLGLLGIDWNDILNIPSFFSSDWDNLDSPFKGGTPFRPLAINTVSYTGNASSREVGLLNVNTYLYNSVVRYMRVDDPTLLFMVERTSSTPYKTTLYYWSVGLSSGSLWSVNIETGVLTVYSSVWALSYSSSSGYPLLSLSGGGMNKSGYPYRGFVLGHHTLMYPV